MPSAKKESFVDKNNNIIADQDSELVDINGNSSDIGEAFLDKNENGIFNLGVDQLVDFDGKNTYTPADGFLSSTLCDPNIYARCSSQKTLHIFQQATFIFSSDNPKTPVLNPAAPVTGTCGTNKDYTIYIPDEKGNILPAGTTIAIASTNGQGSVLSGTSHTIGSSAIATNAVVLGQTNFGFKLQFATTCPATQNSGILTVTVTTPAGGGQAAKITTFPYNYTITP
ncbi:hypothetical protein [Deefgea sp. CFH1-16]|uniref:hypothetical protein n=1 Tax=Deefgea sp. CFH1-16 TaxID=2675457 RepID=UPI0015F7640D|nr:hypothetical protein [Deefgea sp. CFH1-16]MBM5574607.1 hypothetical protein [Deefgea sp. CFH1-16]